MCCDLLTHRAACGHATLVCRLGGRAGLCWLSTVWGYCHVISVSFDDKLNSSTLHARKLRLRVVQLCVSVMHTHLHSGIISLNKQWNELLQSCNNIVASYWNSKGLSEDVETTSGGEERQTLGIFANEGCEIQKTTTLLPFLHQIRKSCDSSRLGGYMLLQTKPCLSKCSCFLSCWTM